MKEKRDKGAPYEWQNLELGKYSGCFYAASITLPLKFIKLVINKDLHPEKIDRKRRML